MTKKFFDRPEDMPGGGTLSALAPDHVDWSDLQEDATQICLREIGHHSLLSVAEELELARKVKAGISPRGSG